MRLSRRALITGSVLAPTAAATAWMLLKSAELPKPTTTIAREQDKRVITANGVPDHAVGDYPNPHDPVPLRPQQHQFTMPFRPEAAEQPTPLNMWLFGIGVNGIPFDPSGPFWQGDGASGWQFEVLHPASAMALGIDGNRAHTQGRGAYHYHGLPTGLLWELKVRRPTMPMYLLGFAADGFPIYGPECPGDPTDLKSKTTRLRSSYRLKAGVRPTGPKGRYDGIFVEDFEYEPGYGDLDEHNGRTGPTPEFPDGTYYYVVTDEFPYIPRTWRGTPDPSFRHGPPPGLSPPLPPELETYQGRA